MEVELIPDAAIESRRVRKARVRANFMRMLARGRLKRLAALSSRGGVLVSTLWHR